MINKFYLAFISNNKKFFFSLDSSLANSKRFLFLLTRRKFLNFKRKFEKFSGYKITSFQDSFTLASFFLILYKFIYRLMEGENPYFIYNIIILLIAVYYFLKFNSIKSFRKFLRERIFKPGLGNGFWMYNGYWTDFFEMFNLKKKLFRKFFYFFIFLRLLILCEPFLFIILNFIITYFLIFNKYLITSSLISIILGISRFTILIEDKNFSNLYKFLRLIDEIPQGYTLKANYKNTIIVGIWITRNFDDSGEGANFEDVFYNEACLDTYLIIHLMHYDLIKNVEKAQLEPAYRTVFLFEKGIYKKNQIFYYILFLLFYISLFSILEINLNNEILSSQPIIKRNNWFTLPFDYFKKLGYLNEIQASHPNFYKILNERLCRVNETTIRYDKDKFPLRNQINYPFDSGHGIVGIGESIKITKEQEKEVFEKSLFLAKVEKENFLNSHRFVYLCVQEKAEAKKTPGEAGLLRRIYLKDSVELPESFKAILTIYCPEIPISFTKDVYQKGIKYLESVVFSKNINNEDLNFHKKLYNFLIKALPEIDIRLSKTIRPEKFLSYEKEQEMLAASKNLENLTRENNKKEKSYKDNLNLNNSKIKEILEEGKRIKEEEISKNSNIEDLDKKKSKKNKKKLIK